MNSDTSEVSQPSAYSLFAIFLVQFLLVKVIKSIVDYLKEVQIEIKKVIWPKRNEVVRLTLVVFLISGIVALYVGIVDYAFTKLLEFLVKS